MAAIFARGDARVREARTRAAFFFFFFLFFHVFSVVSTAKSGYRQRSHSGRAPWPKQLHRSQLELSMLAVLTFCSCAQPNVISSAPIVSPIPASRVLSRLGRGRGRAAVVLAATMPPQKGTWEGAEGLVSRQALT